MTRSLATRRRRSNLIHMKRFRTLAACLSCLAVLAAGVMAVAAFVPNAGSFERMVEQPSAASAPCSHCSDCDSVPCPMPVTVCLQASSTATPTLADGSILRLPNGFIRIDWSFRDTLLRGRSLPPEPFPPRV